MSSPRFPAFVATLATVIASAFAPLAGAQSTSGTPRIGGFDWQTVYMRNTAAPTGVTARDPNWTTRGSCQGCSPTGFADSTVFRRGATTATVYDTSRAISFSTLPWAPNFGNVAMNAAATDTTYMPQFYLRVLQDTTSLAFSGSSALDSVRVAVEVSYDGINWFSNQGTNTQRFDTVYMTSGQDGLQSPTLIGVEASAGEDMTQFVFKCHPQLTTDNARITNRSLCLYNGWARFVVGMDASGQFKLELGTWVNP